MKLKIGDRFKHENGKGVHIVKYVDKNKKRYYTDDEKTHWFNFSQDDYLVKEHDVYYLIKRRFSKKKNK